MSRTYMKYYSNNNSESYGIDLKGHERDIELAVDARRNARTRHRKCMYSGCLANEVIDLHLDDSTHYCFCLVV